MNSAEEEDFFIQVAIDHDLRQTLKAYRIVESAIRKHRDTAPIQHPNSRARVMAMLNADGMAHNQRGNAIPQHTAPSAGRPTGAIGSASRRWGMASVAAVALVVGAFVLAPLIQQEPGPIAEQLRTTPAQLPVPTELPSATTGTTPVTGDLPARPSLSENTPVRRESPVEKSVEAESQPSRPAPQQPSRDRKIETPKVAPREAPKASQQPAVISSDTTPAPTMATPTDVAEPREGTSAAQEGRKPSVPVQITDSAAKVRFQLNLPD